MNPLAQKIASAVALYGHHVIRDEELSGIWHHKADLPKVEKRMHLMNLASALGLSVHVNEDLSSAIFRRFE